MCRPAARRTHSTLFLNESVQFCLFDTVYFFVFAGISRTRTSRNITERRLPCDRAVDSRLLYCAPAWSGFCSAADREQLQAFLRRCKRYGYCDRNTPRISELFNDADDVLFQSVLHRPNQYLLQDREPTQYSLRFRSHTKELIQKTSNLNNCHFLIRLLYKDCY